MSAQLSIIKTNKRQENEKKFPTWAIATISIVGFIIICTLICLIIYLINSRVNTITVQSNSCPQPPINGQQFTDLNTKTIHITNDSEHYICDITSKNPTWNKVND